MGTRAKLHPKPRWVMDVHDLDLGMEDPQAHAATLCETADGLLLAYFGGEYGGTIDQGIWLARQSGGRWELPMRVAWAYQPGTICWNPVLHQMPDSTLLLFHKQGARVSEWRGFLQRSRDGGQTWDRAFSLPRDVLGPTRNKPIDLGDGSLLCGSSTEDGPWRVRFETTSDMGTTWAQSPPIAEPKPFGAIQPSILPWPSGRWQALCRTRVGRIGETFSEDGGRTWSALRLTPMPNPNAAVDAVILDDGRGLLVYNPAVPGAFIHDHRERLAVALSDDEGTTWREIGVIEDEAGGEFSYPAVICTREDLVHVAYTTGEGWTGIRHLVLDPQALPS